MTMIPCIGVSGSHRSDKPCFLCKYSPDPTLTFEAGFACALACLVRDYDQPTMAATIARDNGVTLKMIRAAGVDPADLKTLRGIIA